MTKNDDEKTRVVLKQVVVKVSFIDFLERAIQKQKLEQETIKAMQTHIQIEA